MVIPQVEEDHYKLKIIGRSGIFDMGNDTHVEYLQTSLSIDQIEEISSVRKEFKRGELPFDLMMQREVDDERIKNELIPYLIENELSFFPPITVVILETASTTGDETKIKEKYPALNLESNYNDGNNIFEKRKFGNLFSIDILKEGTEKRRWFTKLTVGSNATLLAVDGQHRLIALQAILNKLSDIEQNIYKDLDKTLIDKIKGKNFDNLTIPITFIFIPQLHEGNEKQLSLVEAFRKIFVDINRNARKVNEMRNVLLDEQDLLSIFTRKVCGKIQEGNLEFDSISIDEIEWEKTKKENQLSNPLAITNILFLREMFSSWAGENFKISMNLARYSKELEVSDEYSYDSLDVEYFSYQQKNFVISKFEDNYTISFLKLINSLPHILKRSKIIEQIKFSLKDRLNSRDLTEMEFKLNSKIEEVLFFGEEKKVHLKDKQVKSLIDELLSDLVKYQKDNSLDIVRTRVFQEAYFNTLFKIYNNKVLLDEKSFENFSNFIYDNSQSKEYFDIWKIIFVNNKELLEKALKGRSGYSRSATILESFENLLYLFMIKIFKDRNIKISKHPEDYINSIKRNLLENSKFKYKKDVEKTSSGEKETKEKVELFEIEFDKTIDLFSSIEE